MILDFLIFMTLEACMKLIYRQRSWYFQRTKAQIPHDRFLSLLALTPTDVATGFGHPNQGPITFLANISPKPSITPFTNGKNILIARDENSAITRVRVESEESNTESVSEGGGAGAGG